jgi:hypothetical protein
MFYLECIMVINKSWYFCSTQQANTATAVKNMIVMYNTGFIMITTIQVTWSNLFLIYNKNLKCYLYAFYIQ